MKPLYLELEAVATVVALAATTVQRLVRDGEFPPPRQLSGRRVAWLVREVEEWAEARPVSDLAPPSNTSRRQH
ncbi:AlpA family phage regulatory protein [Massilia sp. YIM B02769]|uniref:helix-turn-helix transcriptional regulator n=1 Tax=Massilia sp. YIM B02769 TaxID=3050129 RepID=UPI0025B70AE3|nr:AlpA family phage regulatory protein [Massilia sp. YIM B02769]